MRCLNEMDLIRKENVRQAVFIKDLRQEVSK